MDFNNEIQVARGQRIKNCNNVFMQDLFFPSDVMDQIEKIIEPFELKERSYLKNIEEENRNVKDNKR